MAIILKSHFRTLLGEEFWESPYTRSVADSIGCGLALVKFEELSAKDKITSEDVKDLKIVFNPAREKTVGDEEQKRTPPLTEMQFKALKGKVKEERLRSIAMAILETYALESGDEVLNLSNDAALEAKQLYEDLQNGTIGTAHAIEQLRKIWTAAVTTSPLQRDQLLPVISRIVGEIN